MGKALKKFASLFGFIDLTKGSIIKCLIVFLVPVFLANLSTQCLNLVNTLVLKSTVGGDSVTAMNQTNSINSILIMFAYGCGSGFSTLGGNAWGKKHMGEFKSIFHTSIVLSSLVGFVLMVAGFICLKPLLTFFNVNAQFFNLAYSYYMVVLAGYIIMVLRNLLEGFMRIMGNSFFPFASSIAGMTIHIGLLFLLTSKNIANLDTVGCGVATIISNTLIVIADFVYILKKHPELKFSHGSFHYDTKLIKPLLKQGLPLGFQWSVLFIGSFILGRQVNMYGVDASKAMTIYTNIENYSTIFFSSMAATTLSFVAQNYGAKNYERMKKGIKICIFVDFVGYLITFLIGYIIIPYVPYIFFDPAELEGTNVIKYASAYLHILYPALILQGLVTISRSCLMGIKKSMIPFFSGVGELGIRLLVSLLLPLLVDPNYKATLSFQSYVAISFSNASAWLISVAIMGVAVVRLIFLNKELKQSNPNQTQID